MKKTVRCPAGHLFTIFYRACIIAYSCHVCRKVYEKRDLDFDTENKYVRRTTNRLYK